MFALNKLTTVPSSTKRIRLKHTNLYYALILTALACRIHDAQAAPGRKGTAWATYSTTAAAPDGLDYKARLSLIRETLPKYGPSFQQLEWEVTPETSNRLHVKLKPTDQERWEVPESLVQRPGAEYNLTTDQLMYEVDFPDRDAAFALKVLRKATGQPIFDTTGHQFIFKDQYIELTTKLPSDASIYGLGEVTHTTGLLLPRDGTVITLWNRDLGPNSIGFNLYGSHPFYLQVNKDGLAHGVLLLNSNGMDVTLNTTSLTYRVIGGLVDLYFFLGPSPEEVIRQYHQVIGAPAMQPYWAFGAHQSKWGYQNLSIAEEVVANYSKAGLALEGLFLDIEYMGDNFRTMTYSEDRYPAPRMKVFAEQMHARGQHWVPILNPGVGTQKGYQAYEEGNRDDIWIKDHTGMKPYLGQVWPGPAYYPDYLASPNVSSWLKRQLNDFYKQAPFDGVWLDMNEASNFCAGLNCELETTNATKLYWVKKKTPVDFDLKEFFAPRITCLLKCQQPTKADKLSYPPYRIANSGYDVGRKAVLQANSISPTALHADGAREYDAHNLYGTSMAQKHYQAVEEITGKRPFVLSRSTFPGAGRYVAHWTGDNSGNWHELFHSIQGILSANMWGIAMVGADICGFNDAAFENKAWPPTITLPNAEYEELCNRWTMAGAFYPFSRNHISIGHVARSHEPYWWPSVTAAHRKAYGLRYQLLTYIYSSLYVAHSRGGTLARPLLFTDASDLQARDATRQWMLGESVLISPVMSPNTTTINPHFTAGTWYSAWDYSRINITQGRPVSLNVPVGDIAVHYRGGSIIPLQPPANVTRDVRYAPVTLVVTLPAKASVGSTSAIQGPSAPYALDEECAAAHAQEVGKLVSCGFLYSDEDSVTVGDHNTVQVWHMAAAAPDGRSGHLTSNIRANNGPAKGRLRITAVHIVGTPAKAANASPRALILGGSANLTAQYDAEVGVVKISGLNHDVGQPLNLTWSL